MAANPETGIDFYSDRFVVIKNGVITNYMASWPRLDGGPVAGGLPADEQWFKRCAPADRSIYDHRFSITSTWDGLPADPPAAEGHPTGEWKEVLSAVLRPEMELKQQVDAACQAANVTIHPESADPSYQVRVSRAITRKMNGTHTEEDTALLVALDEKADLLQQNEVRRAELYANIEAGEEYDLTVGWLYGSAA